jgi:hypothetical protein
VGAKINEDFNVLTLFAEQVDDRLEFAIDGESPLHEVDIVNVRFLQQVGLRDRLWDRLRVRFSSYVLFQIFLDFFKQLYVPAQSGYFNLVFTPQQVHVNFALALHLLLELRNDLINTEYLAFWWQLKKFLDQRQASERIVKLAHTF